jgi:NADH:ubiquinone oxidoreductase subunit F (NADH-binding)
MTDGRAIPSALQGGPEPAPRRNAHARFMTSTLTDIPPALGRALPQPRLLSRVAPFGPAVSLDLHRRTYPAPPAPRSGSRPELIDEVDRAGLRGRGGARFPTADKMRSVAGGKKRPIVVANGTEGEPSSGKDRLLITRAPHLVLDGALWAAAAIGADQVIISVDRAHPESASALRHALAERDGAESVAVGVRIAETPPRYVAGESSALVHWLNGGLAKPTAGPRPHDKGVAGRPTLVQNVETLAHLAQIESWGAEWFRQRGTADDPGTSLFTVTGAVAQPSVVEAPMGTTIGEIIALAGGQSRPLQALLVGGFFGTWITAAEGLDAPYCREGLERLGAAPGAGVIVAFPTEACGIAETAMVMGWYAAESAGQCGPCLYGLADLAAGAARLGAATGAADELARMRRWAGQIEGRGGCRHPDGATHLLRSAFTVFRADVDRHLGGLPCLGASRPPALRVPRTSATWR